ncbi:extracellular matrix regulator RemB [Bacillus coahuilensis]|uniref:extracellular matrix regulator RemB n=1 Tax=Bacillus coahuilensis TaxID=408580 RepID=UPI0009D686FE
MSTKISYEKNEKKVIRLGENECKSIVVTHQNIYLSPFASTTLKKRTLKPLL